jgi:EAL domain-containing protein (putative c-di-GMP-specific phosphodiesterase class I)
LTAAETGEAMPIPIFAVSNLDVKIDDVCRLLSGQRMFGVPSVLRGPQDATDSTESKTSKRKPPLPPYLTLQSQDLKNSRPRPTVPKKQSLAYSLGEGADHCEQRPKTALGASKTDPEAHADSDVMEQATVNAPPEFTPAERRKKYVSLLNVQAAQNTVSRSDMQRFSRRQLSTWLESIAHEDPTMGIFVLLLWTLGMPPERLVIEITEHAIVHDYRAIGNALAPIRKAGAQLAVDDAGAGYASFRHILHLHPEIIKLDMSLTRDVDTDTRRQALAAALTEFARRVGSRIVAEGVETAGELDMLRSIGPMFGQGYLFAKPQEPQAFRV